MVLLRGMEEHHMPVCAGRRTRSGQESGFSQGRKQTPFLSRQQPLLGSLSPQNAFLLCNSLRHFAFVQSPWKAQRRSGGNAQTLAPFIRRAHEHSVVPHPIVEPEPQ